MDWSIYEENYLQTRVQFQKVETTVCFIQIFYSSGTNVADHLCKAHSSLIPNKIVNENF